MNERNINFSCLKCKCEITLPNDKSSLILCPECDKFDLKIMNILENDKNEESNHIDEDSLNLVEIKYPYDVKPIYEFKTFENLMELLKICGLPKLTDGIDIDRRDLAFHFNHKLNSNIHLLTLDFKTFNELDLDKLNCTHAVIIFYIQREISMNLIKDLLDNFSKKAPYIDLLSSFELDNILPQEQMIDIYYV